MPVDDREDIVEVVSQAAGQSPDGVHPLHFAQPVVRGEDRLRGGRLLEGRADHPGRCPQRVGLERRPGPFAPRVVEPEVAPPAAADRDRRHDDRADLVRLEQTALVVREVGHVAGDEPARRELALPAWEVAGTAPVRAGRRGGTPRDAQPCRASIRLEPSAPRRRSTRTTRLVRVGLPDMPDHLVDDFVHGFPTMNRSPAWSTDADRVATTQRLRGLLRSDRRVDQRAGRSERGDLVVTPIVIHGTTHRIPSWCRGRR